MSRVLTWMIFYDREERSIVCWHPMITPVAHDHRWSNTAQLFDEVKSMGRMLGSRNAVNQNQAAALHIRRQSESRMN